MLGILQQETPQFFKVEAGQLPENLSSDETPSQGQTRPLLFRMSIPSLPLLSAKAVQTRRWSMSSSSSSSKRAAPLASIYVAELEEIWRIDKRIPTPASRKAWATARGLDPALVHAWWYRRRPRAKKLKIRIPSDTYDLGIGRPPTPPPPDAPVVKVKRVRGKAKGKAKGKGRGKGKARALAKVKVEEQTVGSVSSSAVEIAANVASVKHEEDEEDQDLDLLWASESGSGLRLSDDDDLEDFYASSMRSSSPISSSSSDFFLPSSDDTPYDTSSSPPSSPNLSSPIDESLMPSSPFLELQKLMLERQPNTGSLLRCPSPLQLDQDLIPSFPGSSASDAFSIEGLGDADDPEAVVSHVQRLGPSGDSIEIAS